VQSVGPAGAGALRRGESQIPIEVTVFDKDDVMIGTKTLVLDVVKARAEAARITDEQAAQVEDVRREALTQDLQQSEELMQRSAPVVRQGPNVTEQLMQSGMPGQQNVQPVKGPLAEAVKGFFTPDYEQQRQNTPQRSPRPVPQAPGLAQQAVDTILRQGPQGAAPGQRKP
jgi:hypothetical protein